MNRLPFIERLSERPALLGAVLALVVAVASYAYLSSADTTASTAPTVAEVERATIVIASRDIEVRAVIGELQLELRSLPVDAIHPFALATLDDAVGLFATTNITAGQQMLSSHVTADDSGGGLARLVPIGQRAYAIPVSDAIAAGGLIVPGDRIDILALFVNRDSSELNTVSVVAEDLEVIAVSSLLLGTEVADEEATGTTDSGAPNRVRATVTVAVLPLQAQRLALAEEFGVLRLILRNPEDAQASGVDPIQLSSLTIGG